MFRSLAAPAASVSPEKLLVKNLTGYAFEAWYFENCHDLRFDLGVPLHTHVWADA